MCCAATGRPDPGGEVTGPHSREHGEAGGDHHIGVERITVSNDTTHGRCPVDGPCTIPDGPITVVIDGGYVRIETRKAAL